jgi:serine phosphatase RsbU (regulator of sigma subunit)
MEPAGGWEQMPLAVMRAVWDSVPTLVVVTTGPEHIVTYQNPTSTKLFGPRPLGVPMVEAFPELSAEGRVALERVFTTGVPVVQPQSTPGVQGASGDEVLITYVFAPLGQEGEAPRGVFLTAVDVTAEAHAARAAEQSALLSELSERMNAAPDPAKALQTLTDTLVPGVADLAAVFVVPEPDQRASQSRARRAAGDHGPMPPNAMTIGPALLDQAGMPPRNQRGDQPSPLEGLLAAGRSLLIGIQGEIGSGSATATQRDPATDAWFRAGDVHNMAVLPLALAGRLAGAVVLLSAGPRAPYREADLPFLEQAAARAAAAVSHLRVVRQTREIALELQHALLPETPAGLPGVEVAVRYVAGGPDVEIGGDWWDVCALDGGRTGIGLGDVAGRGLQAAVVMGQARSAMRAAALAHLTPSAVLTLLDEQLAGLFESPSGELAGATPRFATAVYAVLDPGTQTLRVANAGHPALLVRSPGQRPAEVHARPGPPLGLRMPAYDELEVAFPAGSLLLGFTDGLVESRVLGVPGGIGHLAAYLESVPEDESVQAIADGALSCMSQYVELQDDIALVVLRSSLSPVG